MLYPYPIDLTDRVESIRLAEMRVNLDHRSLDAGKASDLWPFNAWCIGLRCRFNSALKSASFFVHVFGNLARADGQQTGDLSFRWKVLDSEYSQIQILHTLSVPGPRMLPLMLTWWWSLESIIVPLSVRAHFAFLHRVQWRTRSYPTMNMIPWFPLFQHIYTNFHQHEVFAH
jgi:hypothetical protein